MRSQLLNFIPQVIILVALVWLLIRTRNILSLLMVITNIISLVFGQMAFQLSLINPSLKSLTFSEKFQKIALYNNISFASYIVFAICFLVFIVQITKPVKKEYEFLSESKQEDTQHYI